MVIKVYMYAYNNIILYMLYKITFKKKLVWSNVFIFLLSWGDDHLDTAYHYLMSWLHASENLIRLPLASAGNVRPVHYSYPIVRCEGMRQCQALRTHQR